MQSVNLFITALSQMGSNVVYHRESSGDICPCVTPEGSRDPVWHKAHPEAPVCNEQARLNPTIVNANVKAIVHPAMRSGRQTEVVQQMFGEIQADDQLGFFPATWQGTVLDFFEWNDSGSDYIMFDGRHFVCVNADKFMDIDGSTPHHWEVALRLIKSARPS